MIDKLKLSDFRNFKSKTLEFSDKMKTNILEALYLLSTGKSFKARVEGEMIKYEQQLARVTGGVLSQSVGPVRSSSESGVLSRISPEAFPPVNKHGTPSPGLPDAHHPTNLEVIITTGENGWPKKRLLVGGVPKRTVDFAGNFKTVLFGPWDMDLVTESPSIRRRFLDNVLSQVDREYRRAVLSYEKGLRQRNRLLFRIREEGIPRSQLVFWNQLLIKNGDYISQKRAEFIEFVNSSKSQITNHYSLEYDNSVISEGRLEQYKNEEIAAATTLVGPHRDDFIFFKEKERNLASYGSRGEQRMGVLWLKMAELDFIELQSENEDSETISGRPTLLLDDIFSELDHEHRGVVMSLAKKQQTILTTADEHFVEDFGKVERIELSG
jgi:DNA replication and repair protein RecF